MCRQSRQNQANTRSFILKLKNPLDNMCSGQKQLFYPTPEETFCQRSKMLLLNSLNNFKNKLKGIFQAT